MVWDSSTEPDSCVRELCKVTADAFDTINVTNARGMSEAGH